MIDAAVIIPVCATNAHCLTMAQIAMRTCRASTSARILILGNNTPDEAKRDMLHKECDLLGMAFHYMDGPFSISKAFNLGTQMTHGKYIAYGTSDVIYYPFWLENIIELWEQNPQYYCLCNYSFDLNNNPCVSRHMFPEKRIVNTHNPSSGVLVLKRESGYVWDEFFHLWEIDTDFQMFIEKNGYKAGYCMNARCDHLIDGVKAHVDYQTNLGLTSDQFYVESKKRIKEKWGELYKG